MGVTPGSPLPSSPGSPGSPGSPSSPRGVDRLALGTAQLGGLFRVVSDELAHETLQAAWDAGIRHFDTAPHYGVGLSEERLGAFLRQHPRDSYTVSTKVGRLLVDVDDPDVDLDGIDGFYGTPRRTRVYDVSASGVMRSVEDSLTRMGLDRIDTLYLHDPDDHLDQAITEAAPALVRLRDEGVVRHVGAGMNFAAPLARIVRETAVDQLMLAGRYTLLDRSSLEELLPLCVERDVSVVAVGVFNSGLLADPRPGANFNYTSAPPEVVEKAVELRESCQRHGTPLRAAAVQFPLAHPAVSQVAVGCRGASQVADAVEMFRTPVPEALREELGFGA